MNKKIIAFLLIFSLITVGLTSVTANETASIADNNELSNTEDTTISNNYEITLNEESDETNMNDSIDTEGSVDENITEEPEKNISNSDIMDMGAVREIFSTLSDEEKDLLTYLLVVDDREDFKDLIKMLKSDNFDEEAFLTAVEALDRPSYHTFVDLLVTVSSGETPFSPAVPDLPSKPVFEHIDFKVDNVVNTVGDVKVNSYVSSVSKSTSEKFRPYYKEQSKVNILDYLIYRYIIGDLTFDDFVKALEFYGFDASDIKLNEDGTIEWDGKIIPAPIDFKDNSIDDKDMDTANNDTNVDNSNTDSNIDNSTTGDIDQAISDESPIIVPYPGDQGVVIYSDAEK